MKYENGILSVENTSFGLSKIYNDYPLLLNNYMFLTDFIDMYKVAKSENSTNIEENDNEVIYNIKTLNNKYRNYMKLYISKSNKMPKQLIVQDNNKKDTAYILYNEIKFNH